MVTGSSGSNENTASMTEGRFEEKQPSPDKAPRNPRWTQQETMVLLEGKRIAEERGQPKGRRSSVGRSEHQAKWDFVSSHCKQNGVSREPVQCRKRWSNLASDFRKIKQWESQVGNEDNSYWKMKTDSRRARKLPGLFDREVYEFWDGKRSTEDQLALVQVNVEGYDCDGLDGMEAEDLDEATEDEETEEDAGARQKNEADGKRKNIPSPTPISEMKYQPFYQGYPNQGESTKQPGSNFWRGSPSQKGAKRRRQSSSEYQNSDMDNQLIKALERNTDLMNELLKAQNRSLEIDREQRKEQHENLMGALTKITDAIEKIADKSDSNDAIEKIAAKSDSKFHAH